MRLPTKMNDTRFPVHIICGLIILVSAAVSEQICNSFPKYNCSCVEDNTNGIRINCVNTSLTEIPPDFPSPNEMTFKGNNLTIIDTLNYPGLTHLILSRNHIEFVKKEAFNQLDNLESLVLSDNEISKLTSHHFSGLSHLTQLEVRNNPLYTLTSGTFSRSNLPKLTILDLENCKIHVIDHDAFVGLSNLNSLDLSHNKLYQLPRMTGTTRLEVLDLSYNAIETLLIKDVMFPFEDMRSLTDLKLNYNKLDEIEEDGLKGLKSLQKLYLDHNSIVQIHFKAFADLEKLRILDLSYNMLQILSPDHISTVGMEKIVLHHNTWECSCKTQWLTTDKVVAKFNAPKNMRCSSPDSVKGDMMSKADKHVYDCHDPHHGFHSNTVALAVGILVGLIVTIFGSILLYKLVLQKKLRRRPPSGMISTYSRVHDTRELIYNDDGII